MKIDSIYKSNGNGGGGGGGGGGGVTICMITKLDIIMLH